jgi:hypothetical protein
MLRRILPGVLITVLVVGALAAVGGLAYRAGIIQGLTQSGKVEFVAPPAGGFYPYHPGLFFHPFSFLGCLVPLFFFFLFFGVMRMVFFRPWGWRHGGPGLMHHGPWGGERGHVPSMFEEWHKRAHGEGAPGEPEPPKAS